MSDVSIQYLSKDQIRVDCTNMEDNDLLKEAIANKLGRRLSFERVDIEEVPKGGKEIVARIWFVYNLG